MRAIALVLTAGLTTSVSTAQSLTIRFTADQTQILTGDTVTWTVTAEFSGGLPGSYFAAINASFIANDDTLGVAKPMEGLDAWGMPFLGAIAAGTPDYASLRNIFAAQQALFGAVDTSNPLVIGTFDVVASFDGLGYLSYAGGPADNNGNPSWAVVLWDGVTPITLAPPNTSLNANYVSDSVGVNIPAPWTVMPLLACGSIARRRRQ